MGAPPGMHAAEEAEVPLPLLTPIERELRLAGRQHGVVPVLDEGIRVRWDSWVSVMYSMELNSATSSVTPQRTDRHGILGEKPSDFQLFS